jgi:hypothetical protein
MNPDRTAFRAAASRRESPRKGTSLTSNGTGSNGGGKIARRNIFLVASLGPYASRGDENPGTFPPLEPARLALVGRGKRLTKSFSAIAEDIQKICDCHPRLLLTIDSYHSNTERGVT